MKSRHLPFSRVYRQFRYGAKQLNRQIADGSFARFSPQKQARIQAKVLRLYNRLSKVISGRHLRHVLAGAAMVIGLAGQVQAQNFAPVVQNPFGLSGNGYFNLHTLVDIDGDGDLDIISSAYNSTTYSLEVTYVENTGTAAAPAYAAPVVNTFGLNTGLYFLDLEFADMDADGDLDAFGSSYGGGFTYHENIGTATMPNFAAPVNNPFGIPGGYYYSFPTVGDIDADGDLDLIICEYYGEFRYHENTGTNVAPAFATGIVGPFGLPSAGASPYFYHPEMVDLDGDGDLDVLAGEYNYGGGDFSFFENTGTVNAPAFGAPQINPFGLTGQTDLLFAAVGDLDGDMDFDVLASGYGGEYFYHENIDTVGNPINTAPTLDTLVSQTLCSGDTLDIAFMATDADGDSLSLIATSDDQAILADANITITGTDPNYNLEAIPTPGVFGIVNLTVMALDGTDTTSSTFPLLVQNCNNNPSIGTLTDVSLCRDSAWNDFTFQVLDPDGDALTVTATSDNQTLLPDANISVTGGIPLYTFSGTPAAGETGTATVSVVASDGIAADTASFVLTVNACNTPPVISQVEDQTACSFFIFGPISLEVNDADGDSLTVTATSSDQTLIPDANITLSGSGPGYDLTLLPVAGETGMADITLMAADDSSSVSESFTVTVDLCTNIQDPAQQAALSVFPNPTNGLLKLESGALMEIQEIRVLDLQGRMVHRKAFAGQADRWEVDLQELTPGTYVLQIRTLEGVVYRRVNKS